MKRLDCQEDMQNLTRIMSLTSSKDIPARKKALTFVMVRWDLFDTKIEN